MAEVQPKVVIYDGEVDGTYTDLALEGATDAGWEAHVYGDPINAADALDSTFGAVVTGLGSVPPFENSPLPGLVVIEKSNELVIPRAILTGRPGAEEFVRPDSKDMVITKESPLEIPSLVSSWLISLLQGK